MNTLEELYFEELRDLVSAETQLIAALPKMAKGAHAPELKQAIESHLEQTRTHKQRLETILKSHGEKSTGKHCKGMEGVIAEGAEVLKEEGDPAVLDAAMIAAAQRVEHYEMAGYGSARTFASKLGFMEDKALLQQTLDEEGQTDLALTQLAQGVHGAEGINQRALGTTTAGSNGHSMSSKSNGKSENGQAQQSRSHNGQSDGRQQSGKEDVSKSGSSKVETSHPEKSRG